MLALLRVYQGGMQSINGCCCNCVRLLATGSIACTITREPHDRITSHEIITVTIIIRMMLIMIIIRIKKIMMKKIWSLLRCD